MNRELPDPWSRDLPPDRADVETLIAQLAAGRNAAEALLARLADESARLRAGQALGPEACVRMLRAHAVACVQAGEPVRFYMQDGIHVEAQLCKEHETTRPDYAPGDEGRCWKCYRTGGANGGYESHVPQDYLLKHEGVERAVMFAANVRKR